MKKLLSILMVLSFAKYLSAAILAEPEYVDHFSITAPPEVKVDQPFDLEIEAGDVYDNVVTGYDKLDKEIEIKTIGTGQFAPELIKSNNFVEGKIVIKCSYTRAELLKIVVKEKGSSAFGSVFLKVLPGKPAYFESDLPLQVRAGEEFLGKLTVRDLHGNPVTSYGQEEGKIRISVEGEGEFIPASYFSKRGFKDGSAWVKLSYNKTGRLTISFEEAEAKIYGKGVVEVKPRLPFHFDIVAPEKIVPGRTFPVDIKTRDAYDNLCTNYDREGKGVIISTSGTGLVTPNFIPADSFKEGIARLNFIYTKAESFTIFARERTESEEPRVIQQIEEPEIDQQERIKALKIKFDKYVDAGEYEKAREVVKEIVDLEPTDADTIRVKERLEQLIKILQ